MLPISRPVLITLVIVNGLWVWNDLLIALMLLRHTKMRTIAVALHLVGGNLNSVFACRNKNVILREDYLLRK